MSEPTQTTSAAARKSSSAGSTGAKRNSQQGSGMFANLSNLKRDGQDPSTQQRKGSLSEQTAKPTIVGQMWNKFSKGTDSGSSK